LQACFYTLNFPILEIGILPLTCPRRQSSIGAIHGMVADR
jgi:hypothetical protein